MVGFWNAMPTRNARAATLPPTDDDGAGGRLNQPLASRRMVDLPQPDGPTNATNSPSAMRSVVLDSAGTARSPRPNGDGASDNSIAMGAASG